MAYGSAPFTRFGGLDLRSAVDEVGDYAIDLLNVELDRPGIVRSRDGYDNMTGSAAAGRYGYVFVAAPTGIGASLQVFAARGATIDRYPSQAPSTVEATHTVTGRIWRGVDFATPTTKSVYFSTGVDTLVRNRSGSFTNPTATVDGTAGRAMPKGYAGLLVQPIDNRLVVLGTTSTGGPHGAASSESHVWFSEEGDAESWNSNNYVQLSPGDGAAIIGGAVWNGQLFVFKPNRFFVFYGNSQDAAGNPIFNFRSVEFGSRMHSSLENDTGPRVCAGTDGVYFVTSAGIYRTTGGPPQLVSDALLPAVRKNQAPSTFTPGWIYPNFSGTTLGWHGERLFVACRNATAGTPNSYNNYLLVYDPSIGSWTVWDIPAAGLGSFIRGDTTSAPDLIFSYATGSNHLGYMNATTPSTDDDGAAITSRYRSGFYDLGTTEEKSIVGSTLWGTGTVAVSLARDYGSLDTTANVTLGTSPAIARGRSRKGKSGTLFSHQFASVSGGAWSLQRFHHDVDYPRVPGTKTT